MELVKLNVLHLHLSDNEGFRVESRFYPKLHEVSSYQNSICRRNLELVTYAGERGIRIVPEFDVPGHSRAILKAYPEFASGEVEGRDSGIHSSSSLNNGLVAHMRLVGYAVNFSLETTNWVKPSVARTRSLTSRPASNWPFWIWIRRFSQAHAERVPRSLAAVGASLDGICVLRVDSRSWLPTQLHCGLLDFRLGSIRRLREVAPPHGRCRQSLRR